MEWALDNYTYRECCNTEVRECDDCDCYQCEDCGEVNFYESAPENENQCLECFTEKIESNEV